MQISFQQASELERDGLGWGGGGSVNKCMNSSRRRFLLCMFCVCSVNLVGRWLYGFTASFIWLVAVWVYSQFYMHNMVGDCVGLQPILYGW